VPGPRRKHDPPRSAAGVPHFLLDKRLAHSAIIFPAMRKQLKTFYVKLPEVEIREIKRVAELEHRTFAAQLAVIVKNWREALYVGKAGADPNAG